MPWGDDRDAMKEGVSDIVQTRGIFRALLSEHHDVGGAGCCHAGAAGSPSTTSIVHGALAAWWKT